MGKFRLAILLGVVSTSVFGTVKSVAQTMTSAEKPYSIVLTTESTVAKLGVPVYAKITVKNASDYPLPIQEGYLPAGSSGLDGIGLDGSYTWSCTDGAAQSVRKLRSARNYVVFELVRTRVMRVRLDLACDLSRPGLYRATVSRKSWRQSNEPIVASNSISIEVK
jgi:hypothetical protein